MACRTTRAACGRATCSWPRRGGGADGNAFVDDAIRKGAVAVVCDGGPGRGDFPAVIVPDAGTAAGVLANAVRDDPSHAIQVLGVTGTNGKTTVAYLLRSLLASVGQRCGMIGTVEIDDGRRVTPATMTTPGPVDLADLLATMRDNGCAAAAMEVSSHALAQGRAAGVRFAGAGFTNLTGDHLDYHGTMDLYAAAKAVLFAGLDPTAAAVVNAGDPWAARMLRDTNASTTTFGVDRPADYAATEIAASAGGTRFVLGTPNGTAAVDMKLVGRHNVENALCAAALAAQTFGLTPQQLADGLAQADGAPGRLQRVDAGQPFGVMVDYAHTDDALANVLTALRPVTRNKLRVVFGCGGDRDRTKRPRMAAVAERLADAVYVTSDNPRTEDPTTILAEIVTGLKGEPALVEPDRRTAIRRVLADAGEGDVVLIAGKGHENYQIVGTTKHPFNDAEEARRALYPA